MIRRSMIVMLLPLVACASVDVSGMTPSQRSDLAAARTMSITMNFDVLRDTAVRSLNDYLRRCGREIRIVEPSEHADIHVDYQLVAAICVDCEQPPPEGLE